MQRASIVAVVVVRDTSEAIAASEATQETMEGGETTHRQRRGDQMKRE